MSRKPETARQAYIRVLQSEVERVAKFENQDLQITAELVDAKYLNGDNLVDQDGDVRDVALLGMTVEGRLFLQKLRAEEKADSSLGILMKHGSFVTGAFVGALIPFCLELLRSRLLG